MRIAASALILGLAMQSGPTYDVVSIKQNTSDLRPGLLPPPVLRPDGGFALKNTTLRAVIARGYPGMDEIIGLPDWASAERYDIAATSTLSTATADDRIAMMRAMLADRFQLRAHVEKREREVFDLVLARRDGKLGPGLQKSELDCAHPQPQATTGERPDFTKPPPPCSLRMLGAIIRDREGDKQGRFGDIMEGSASMEVLASALSSSAGRVVIDKTGLSGTYRIAMNYDMRGAQRPPSIDPPIDAGPSVFVAVQEQLGLKLEPSKAQRNVLIIDRIERPTAN